MTRLILFAVVLMSTTPAAAQRPAYPDAALERLRHIRGVWRMESDLVGAQGQVIRTTVVIDSLDWLVPDRIIGFTSVEEESGGVSKGLWFYDTTVSRFYLVSVSGVNGAFWSMSGTLDAWTITSDPKPQRNGSELMIRFHHHDITQDFFRATMEMSTDGGQTWVVRTRQRLTRLK